MASVPETVVIAEILLKQDAVVWILLIDEPEHRRRQLGAVGRYNLIGSPLVLRGNGVYDILEPEVVNGVTQT